MQRIRDRDKVRDEMKAASAVVTISAKEEVQTLLLSSCNRSPWLLGLHGGTADDVALLVPSARLIRPISPALLENENYAWQAHRRIELGEGMYARVCLGNATQNHGSAAELMHLIILDIDPSDYEVQTGFD